MIWFCCCWLLAMAVTEAAEALLSRSSSPELSMSICWHSSHRLMLSASLEALELSDPPELFLQQVLWVAQTVFFISHPPSNLTHFSPGLLQSFERNGILMTHAHLRGKFPPIHRLKPRRPSLFPSLFFLSVCLCVANCSSLLLRSLFLEDLTSSLSPHSTAAFSCCCCGVVARAQRCDVTNPIEHKGTHRHTVETRSGGLLPMDYAQHV